MEHLWENKMVRIGYAVFFYCSVFITLFNLFGDGSIVPFAMVIGIDCAVCYFLKKRNIVSCVLQFVYFIGLLAGIWVIENQYLAILAIIGSFIAGYYHFKYPKTLRSAC